MRPTANWRAALRDIPRGFLQLTPPFVMIARNSKELSLEAGGELSEIPKRR
jgi:hypothetical protein